APPVERTDEKKVAVAHTVPMTTWPTGKVKAATTVGRDSPKTVRTRVSWSFLATVYNRDCAASRRCACSVFCTVEIWCCVPSFIGLSPLRIAVWEITAPDGL